MGERFIIIGRSTCDFCLLAQDLLTASGLQFTFLDYAKFPEYLDEYKEFHNHQTVPIILANNLESGHTRKIGGYTELLRYL